MARFGAVVGLLVLFASGVARAQTPDWLMPRWGAGEAALDAALGDRLTRLEPGLVYADATVTRSIRRIEFGGVDFVLLYQMDREGGGLSGILLTRGRLPATAAQFARAADAFERLHGPADESCEAAGGAGRPLVRARIWNGADWTLRLAYTAFTDSTIDSDPNAEPDPLTSRERSEGYKKPISPSLTARYAPPDSGAKGACAVAG
jgi:hypothetical protein